MTDRVGQGTAQGKVILLGEHAVVYGLTAVAAAINRGALAWARPSSRRSLRGHDGAILSDPQQQEALAALLDTLGVGCLELTVSSDLPLGCGLGGSAALGVAIARAALDLTGPMAHGDRTELSTVLNAALAWERIFHKNPSGLDTTIAALGGCLGFRKGQEPEPLAVGRTMTLVVAVAGPPCPTRTMVERVAVRRQTAREHVDQLLMQIGELAERGKRCIGNADLKQLGELMDQNHELLCELDLSTLALDKACTEARRAGALGAKLTGAGGGGSIVALAPDDGASIGARFEALGLRWLARTIPATAALEGTG